MHKICLYLTFRKQTQQLYDYLVKAILFIKIFGNYFTCLFLQVCCSLENAKTYVLVVYHKPVTNLKPRSSFYRNHSTDFMSKSISCLTLSEKNADFKWVSWKQVGRL